VTDFFLKKMFIVGNKVELSCKKVRPKSQGQFRNLSPWTDDCPRGQIQIILCMTLGFIARIYGIITFWLNQRPFTLFIYNDPMTCHCYLSLWMLKTLDKGSGKWTNLSYDCKFLMYHNFSKTAS
jgi:hypothetical protein